MLLYWFHLILPLRIGIRVIALKLLRFQICNLSASEADGAPPVV
jgi:hypothetical protein